MKLEIKHISIENFRCFEHLETDLWKKTVIKSDNESGKSTIASAILWALTNKDIDGSNSFEIVPQGKYGAVSPAVTLECMINDKPLTLTRTYKAKFNRAREFSGYETVCYINGIEYGARKFQDYISENICNEKIFKILSNPYTFVENCPKEQKELIWQAQRKILMELVKDESDADLAKQDEKWSKLLKPLERYENVSDYLAFIKQNTSAIEKEINSFEAKLEQQQENIKAIDYTGEEITANLDKFKAELEALVKANGEFKAQNRNDNVAGIKAEIEKLNHEEESLMAKYQEESQNYLHEKERLIMQANEMKSEADKHIEKQAKYASAVEQLQTTVISNFCEACGQPLTDKMIANKKAEKAKRISNGNAWIEKERKSAESCMDEYDKLTAIVQSLPEPLYPVRVQEIKERIKELTDQIMALGIETDMEGYAEKSEQIKNDIEANTKKMYDIESNEQCEKKIAELESQHRENNVKLNKFQMASDLCKEFLTYKCKLNEDKINSLFPTVRFQLFEKNKTNDDVKEVCNMTFNGHKYEDLSASTKLVANLELLRAFQNHYNAYIPIICDNCESITADIDMESQCIMMYVKEELCPECGCKSGRRKPNGLWTCQKCGHEWAKKLEIKEK